MNQTERLERELTAWFLDIAQPGTPDIADDILRQTARQRQRPRWTFLERWIPMGVLTIGRRTLSPLPWRLIGMLAVLALLLVATIAFLSSGQSPLPRPFGIAKNGLVTFADGGDIVVVDPLSGTRRVVIGGPSVDGDPVFSRDGTRLAYSRATVDGPRLWLARADGTDQRQLETGAVDLGGGIGWSPDGRSILLGTTSGGTPAISIVPTGGGASRIIDVGMPAEGPMWRPPDGREILFRGQAAGGFGLFAVHPDGSGLRAVTPTNGTHAYDYLYYGWTPDGTQVVYQWVSGAASSPCGPSLCGQRLFIALADGSGQRQITSVESVGAWVSPSGLSVAFWNMDGQQVLNVTAIDGTGAATRTGPSGSSVVAGWTPDGTRILYLADGSDAPMLLDPAGGPGQRTAWRSSAVPDWQRLAP